MKESILALILIPFVSAIGILLFGKSSKANARSIASGSMVLTLLLSLFIVWWDLSLSSGDVGGAEPRGQTRILLLGTGGSGDLVRGINFHVGVDGFNLGMIFLTGLLFPAALWIVRPESPANDWGFLFWLLVLQGLTFGAFLSYDLVVFYLFFELTLIPLFFMIGGWGGQHRIEAATKMFLYGITGSLFTLGGMVGASLALGGIEKGTDFSIPRLAAEASRRGQPIELAITEVEKARQALNRAKGETEILAARARFEAVEHALNKEKDMAAQWFNWQAILFFMLMAGFAVKIPVVPLHFWQPITYRESPPMLTAILSGVLAKLGLFGVVRIVLPILPEASVHLATPVLGTLAVIGILYGALSALGAANMRLMFAYSSISHLGFCLLGLVCLNQTGITGGVFQMLNHGITTGGLFLIVAALLERYPHDEMPIFGGFAKKYPAMGAVAMILILSSVGLPGLNGFVGEIISLMGMYAQGAEGRQLAVLASFGLIFGAWYALTFMMRVFFGEEKTPAAIAGRQVGDLNRVERFTLYPLVVLCFVLGLFPRLFLGQIEPDSKRLAHTLEEARARITGTAPVGPVAQTHGPATSAHSAPSQTNHGEAHR